MSPARKFFCRSAKLYFLALRAQTALRLAALLPAVPALTDESCKSSLDALSAEIAAAEAKLKISQARHDAHAAQANLAVAVGQTRPADWVLEEPPAPGPLPADSQSLLAIAIRQRPEIAVRRRELEAAQRMVVAEGKLTKPSVSGSGVAGVVPAHVAGYEKDYYAAAGLALNLNFLNGGLFAARRTEAARRARAAEQRLKEFENRLAREVSVAFFNAENAFDRLSLSNLFSSVPVFPLNSPKPVMIAASAPSRNSTRPNFQKARRNSNRPPPATTTPPKPPRSVSSLALISIKK